MSSLLTSYILKLFHKYFQAYFDINVCYHVLFSLFVSLVFVYMCCIFVYLPLWFRHKDFKYWRVPDSLYFLVYSPIPCYLLTLTRTIVFHFHLNFHFSFPFSMDSTGSSKEKNLLWPWLWLLWQPQLILFLWYCFQMSH